MNKIYSLLLVITVLTSCQEKTKDTNDLEGISSSEIQSESSEKKKAQPKWTEEDIRIHKEKIQVGKEKLKMAFNGQIENFQKDLKKTEEELDKIKAFEIGRNQATKDAQLEIQYEKMHFLKETINNLKSEYVKIPLHQNFEFHKSPKDVVEHLFYGFKNKDFEKFRYLGDPYGEYDEGILWLTHLEALPEMLREQYFSEFQNPRIMGEPKIEGNRASIEIAIGPSSNKLETINLIKRLDGWYLLEI